MRFPRCFSRTAEAARGLCASEGSEQAHVPRSCLEGFLTKSSQNTASFHVFLTWRN